MQYYADRAWLREIERTEIELAKKQKMGLVQVVQTFDDIYSQWLAI